MRLVEGPRRAPSQLKRPFRGPRRRRGSCWEERKIKVFLPSPTRVILPVWPSKYSITCVLSDDTLVPENFHSIKPPNFGVSL